MHKTGRRCTTRQCRMELVEKKERDDCPAGKNSEKNKKKCNTSQGVVCDTRKHNGNVCCIGICCFVSLALLIDVPPNRWKYNTVCIHKTMSIARARQRGIAITDLIIYPRILSGHATLSQGQGSCTYCYNMTSSMLCTSSVSIYLEHARSRSRRQQHAGR